MHRSGQVSEAQLPLDRNDELRDDFAGPPRHDRCTQNGVVGPCNDFEKPPNIVFTDGAIDMVHPPAVHPDRVAELFSCFSLAQANMRYLRIRVSDLWHDRGESGAVAGKQGIVNCLESLPRSKVCELNPTRDVARRVYVFDTGA